MNNLTNKYIIKSFFFCELVIFTQMKFNKISRIHFRCRLNFMKITFPKKTYLHQPSYERKPHRLNVNTLFPLTISAAVRTAGPVAACVCVSDQCSRLLISPISSRSSSNRFDPAPCEAWQDSCLLEAKKTAQKHRLTSQP